MTPGTDRPGPPCVQRAGPGPLGTRLGGDRLLLRRRWPRAGPAGRRRRRLLTAAAVTVVSACLLVSATPAGAGLVSDQAQASQLQQQIIHQGIVVQQLGARANAAQAKLASLDSRVAATGAQLAADRRATEAATVHLRRVAIDAYMFGSQQSAVLALFDAGNGEQAATGQEYRTLAAGNLRDALDAERVDAARTQAAQSTLRKEQAQVAVTVSQLSTQRQQAQAALHRDATLLSQVHSTIASLQAAAALRQLEAHRAAQEAALAAAQAQQAARAQQESRRHPPPPPVQTVQAAPVAAPVAVSPGTYANPLRAVAALSPERVDQGVDYSGYGPIYAIGDGVVLNTVNGGWPGGTFIAYRLTDGPAVGRVVYVAENVAPAVSVGQRVTAATVLGTLYEGPAGMETGWADPSGDGLTMAADDHQYRGANSTAFGANFSQLLAALGAPAGVLQNTPPTGTLPPGWPTW